MEGVKRRKIARLRITGRHDNVLLQGSACTAGGLVERPGSNEKVWVSHTYFCKILMKTANFYDAWSWIEGILLGVGGSMLC